MITVGSEFQSHGCGWLSTGWAPTTEDFLPRGTSIHGGENGFSQIAVSFIPDGCTVYAGISGDIVSETSSMVKDVQEKGFRFERPPEMKSVWKRLLSDVLGPGDAIFVEANRDFASTALTSTALGRAIAGSF